MLIVEDDDPRLALVVSIIGPLRPNEFPTAGSRSDDRYGAATVPITTATAPARTLRRMPSIKNWLMTVLLLAPIALSVPISLVLSRTV